MLNIRTFVTILSCTLVLAGCAITGSTALYTLPVGSQITVKQKLRAHDGKRLIIQDGLVLQRKDVNIVRPYCQFSLRRSSEETREPILIEPGVFTVTDSYRRQDWSWAEGLQFAGDTDRDMSSIMELSSVNHPEVTRLVCTRWGSVYVGGWVTIADMRATLGDLVEFVIAE